MKIAQRKRHMKMLILALSAAGLVAGCAHDHNAVGRGSETNSGYGLNNSPAMLDPWGYAPPGNSIGSR
jgi:hypothetical protein